MYILVVYQQVYNIPMGTTTKPTSGYGYGYGYIMAIPWPIPTDTHTHDPRGYAVPMQMPNLIWKEDTNSLLRRLGAYWKTHWKYILGK